MIHQPLGGFRGSAADVMLSVKEIQRVKKEMNEILLRHTGQSIEQIERDTDRDTWMTAQTAKEYGIVDDILEKLPSVPGSK